MRRYCSECTFAMYFLAICFVVVILTTVYKNIIEVNAIPSSPSGNSIIASNDPIIIEADVRVLQNHEIVNQPSEPLLPIKIPQQHRSSVHRQTVEKYNDFQVKSRLLREKIKRLEGANNRQIEENIEHSEGAQHHNVSTKNVHIFYSAPVNWYSSPSNLTHMRGRQGEEINPSFQVNSLNTVFYPLLGIYTINTKILEIHFRNIWQMGIQVIIVTWRPNDRSTELLKHILNFAKKYYEDRIQVAIEIDAYEGRDVFTIKNDIKYWHTEFIWSHPALYRVYVESKNDYLPMIYIRDAYRGDSNAWQYLFATERYSKYSLRRTIHDGVFIGHVANETDMEIIRRGKFDGFYTRLVSNGATYSSTWKNWNKLSKTAKQYKLIFIPTVGPGYNERIRKEPKIGSMRRHRSNGQYYGVAWRTAIMLQPQFISIASYNDWPAGNQIEEAIPYAGYKDYSPRNPKKYLQLTHHFVEEYVVSREKAFIKDTYKFSHKCDKYYNNTIC